MGEQDEELARLTDLDVTWGFDLYAFSRDRSQETPAAGDAGDLHACLQELQQGAPVVGNAGDGTAETMDSSQGGAVDASSVPAGRAKTVETIDASKDPSKGGAVDASSVLVGTAITAQMNQQPPAPTKGTEKVSPRSCRVRQLRSPVAGDGYPGLEPTPAG